MATCPSCGYTILFGGIREGDLRFCSAKCRAHHLRVPAPPSPVKRSIPTGLVLTGLIATGVAALLDSIAPLGHPLAFWFVMGIAYVTAGLVVLYLAVRVIRAAWKEP